MTKISYNILCKKQNKIIYDFVMIFAWRNSAKISLPCFSGSKKIKYFTKVWLSSLNIVYKVKIPFLESLPWDIEECITFLTQVSRIDYFSGNFSWQCTKNYQWNANTVFETYCKISSSTDWGFRLLKQFCFHLFDIPPIFASLFIIIHFCQLNQLHQ